jgi:two-component system response regulator AtoC
LRALQERRFERVGGAETVAVDVRVIAATNKDLKQEVALQHFRGDLFYRLDVVNIVLPPLRARVGDIPALADHFIERARTRHGLPPKSVSGSALRALLDYDFPGNVRELQNIIERAVIACRGPVMEPGDLWPPGRLATATDHGRLEGLLDLPFNDAVAAVERELIRRALEASSGNRTDAARRLQINRRLLYSKMREHQLV